MHSTLHDLAVWAASGLGNVLLPKSLAAERFATQKLPGAGEYGLGVQKLGPWYGIGAVADQGIRFPRWSRSARPSLG